MGKADESVTHAVRISRGWLHKLYEIAQSRDISVGCVIRDAIRMAHPEIGDDPVPRVEFKPGKKRVIVNGVMTTTRGLLKKHRGNYEIVEVKPKKNEWLCKCGALNTKKIPFCFRCHARQP